MSKGINKPSVWKKPKSKVYDYNYNLGEHYYAPQLRHMENKYGNRAASPPRAQTFAERFAKDPVYGNNSPLNYRTTDDPIPPPPRRTSLQDEEFGTRSGFGGGRRPLFESRGLSPDIDDLRARPRLNFGDRLLDTVGGFGQRTNLAESNFGQGISSGGAKDDPFDDAFFQRRKLAPPRSADPDFMTEDPFKRRKDLLFNSADDDDIDFKRDSDDVRDVVAGFRSRMKARRQRADEEMSANDSFDTPNIESRVDKIRSRAKARLAELEDDLPNLSLNTSSSSRARAALRDFDDLDSSLSSKLSSANTSSKTMRVTKRTVKTTVESD